MDSPLNQLAIASVGFSCTALILLIFQNRPEAKTTKILANSLLIILVAIQILQALYISNYLLFRDTLGFTYLLLLGLVGPIFYLYSQQLIKTHKLLSPQDSWHFFPILTFALLGLWRPDYFNLTYSLMFLLGGIYMLRLAWSLYQLRAQRRLFKMEFILTASFLSWAIAVAVLGIFNTQTMELLIAAQTIMLAIAIAAALHIQLNYPHLLSSLEEIANNQYKTSTLANIDSEAIKLQLQNLMLKHKIYEDTELSLSSLADKLSLKPYQLSELLNTQLGINFSTYLRAQRIKAAELLLKTEPEASVLAIGLSVGFSSQSAFYSAFKEIHSTAPGQYRRQILGK
jgi:AraC-like DNA-binding protein